MGTRRSDVHTPMLWVEAGEQKTTQVATVAPIAPVAKSYTYEVPPAMRDAIEVGQRVAVPIGHHSRIVRGFCIELAEQPWTHTLRPIAELIEDRSYLTPTLLELGKWIAYRYVCPLGKTLHAIVPAAVRRNAGFQTVQRIKLAEPVADLLNRVPPLGARQKVLVQFLSDHAEPIDVRTIVEKSGVSRAVIRGAMKTKWLDVVETREPAAAPRFDEPFSDPAFQATEEQAAAIETIRQDTDAGRFHASLLFGVSGAGKTEVYIRAMQHVVSAGKQAIMLVPEIALTTQLVSRLACRFHGIAVIHSGLTDVQRALLWHEIADGSRPVIIGTRSAVFAPCPNPGLIVVDEEQESSYKNLQAPRFHVRDVAVQRGRIDNVPVLLGSATPSLETWLACESNPQRAANFSSRGRKDEKNESNSNSRGPKDEENQSNSSSRRPDDHGDRPSCKRIDLPHRVRDLPMPPVEIVDMLEEAETVGRNALLSRQMQSGTQQALDQGGQVVLLINRRGFAGWFACARCKRRIECDRCNTGMVLHKAIGALVCHQCGARRTAPTQCPDRDCGGRMAHQGSGTQRIEEELTKRFPQANLQRVDSDTMRKRGAYERVIDDFEQRRIDILVGTQIVAKGLDFPGVAFVGMIGADASFAAADFRAGERLFQLITQMAGRAGRRDATSRVVIQSQEAYSHAVQCAAKHDYESFAEHELSIRQRLRFPPYSSLARIVIEHARQTSTEEHAQQLANHIRETATDLRLDSTQNRPTRRERNVSARAEFARTSVRDNVDSAPQPIDVIGPNPCLLGRVRDRYRFEVLIRSATLDALLKLLHHLQDTRAFQKSPGTTILDVDPISLA